MTDGTVKNQTRKAQRFGFLALRYFEWVLRGEATEPLLLRKNREDIEYGTQELRNSGTQELSRNKSATGEHIDVGTAWVDPA
jgi:hypothetical protein